MLALGKLDCTLLVLPDKGTALCGSPARGVRNCQEGKDGAKEEGCVLRSRSATERVASIVVVVANGGHDEVGTVHCDHARLCKAGARVVLLDGRVYAHNRDEDTEREVEGDEETIERASIPGEKRIQNTGECDGGDVHACR